MNTVNTFVPAWHANIENCLSLFFRDQNIGDLVQAYTAFFYSNYSGFVNTLLKMRDHDDLPREFPESKYELKFKLVLIPKEGYVEPSIQHLLEMFVFPVDKKARFLSDPINLLSAEVRHKIGDWILVEREGLLWVEDQSAAWPVASKGQACVQKRKDKRSLISLSEGFQRVMHWAKEGMSYKNYGSSPILGKSPHGALVDF